LQLQLLLLLQVAMPGSLWPTAYNPVSFFSPRLAPSLSFFSRSAKVKVYSCCCRWVLESWIAGQRETACGNAMLQLAIAE